MKDVFYEVNMKKYRGILLITVALIVNVVETIYFGCNAAAASPAEAIWDMICNLVCWVGVYFCAFDWIDVFWSKVRLTATRDDEDETSIS